MNMSFGCRECRDGTKFTVPFSMAFQPIVNIATKEIYAYEALVRGVNGEGALTVLAATDAANRYAFDQECRVKAIEVASRLKLAETGAMLSINFMPKAVYEPRACIRRTVATATQTGFPIDKIIFEFTEDERLDTTHLLNILRVYRELGFKTAIDDFGAGYAGLSLLTLFRTDIVKIDRQLIKNIDTEPVKQKIVANIVHMLDDLAIVPICEGVETQHELTVLEDMGIEFVQGYVLARPAFEQLVKPDALAWPAPAEAA